MFDKPIERELLARLIDGDPEPLVKLYKMAKHLNISSSLIVLHFRKINKPSLRNVAHALINAIKEELGCSYDLIGSDYDGDREIINNIEETYWDIPLSAEHKPDCGVSLENEAFDKALNGEIEYDRESLAKAILEEEKAKL
jgi:hypothetical protein